MLLNRGFNARTNFSLIARNTQLLYSSQNFNVKAFQQYFFVAFMFNNNTIVFMKISVNKEVEINYSDKRIVSFFFILFIHFKYFQKFQER